MQPPTGLLRRAPHLVVATRGPTDLHNGILLCRLHHRMVHEGGWSLSMDRDTGRAVFTDPQGKEQATLPRGAPILLG